MKDFMLSNYRNSINPFEDYDSWLANEIVLHSKSNEIVADITANIDETLPEEKQLELIEEAIDEFIKADGLHQYRKVIKGEEFVPLPYKEYQSESDEQEI